MSLPFNPTSAHSRAGRPTGRGRLGDPEIIKLAHGIRLQVDADAEWAHLGALEYDTRHADLVERKCRCQPANAAAGDDYLIIRHSLGPIYSRMNFIILWITTGASRLRPRWGPLEISRVWRAFLVAVSAASVLPRRRATFRVRSLPREIPFLAAARPTCGFYAFGEAQRPIVPSSYRARTSVQWA